MASTRLECHLYVTIVILLFSLARFHNRDYLLNLLLHLLHWIASLFGFVNLNLNPTWHDGLALNDGLERSYKLLLSRFHGSNGNQNLFMSNVL